MTNSFLPIYSTLQPLNEKLVQLHGLGHENFCVQHRKFLCRWKCLAYVFQYCHCIDGTYNSVATEWVRESSNQYCYFPCIIKTE